MRASRDIVALLLLMASSALGQTFVGLYSVSGTVQNAVSGEPIRSAVVHLQREPDADLPAGADDPNSSQPLTKSTVTGFGGEFLFNGLPAGHYICAAERPDFESMYMLTADGHEFVLPRPSTDGPIRIHLRPYGAIQGVVTDQFGEPVAWVLVVVFSIGDSRDERHAQEIGRLRTDDLGRFRLTRVPPGRYFVKAVARDGGTEVHMGAEDSHYAPWESFAPVYFPRAPTLSSATPVEVTSGAILETNLQITFKPAFKIRGKVEGLSAPQGARFELLRGNEPGEAQRTLLDGAGGEFQIFDVLPGTYTLRVTQEKARGETQVTVGNADLAGISIALKPAVTLMGRTHATVSEPEPGYNRCSMGLYDLRSGDVKDSGMASADGQFTIQDVFPGQYQVAIRCSSGYPVSASFGSLDLLKNRIVTISSEPAPEIEVEIQQGGGLLKARIAGGGPSTPILLAPRFPTLTGPICQPTMQMPGAPEGEAVFASLAPGVYTVYTLSANEYMVDDAFLQSLLGGTDVDIQDRKTVEVTVPGVSK